jgi:hypothetical protein
MYWKIIIQWNKSVPEHKTKTKDAPVSEQNFGSRTGKLATTFNLRHQPSYVQIKSSFIFVYILSIYCVYSFRLRFYAFSLFFYTILCMKYCYKGLNKQSSGVRERIIHFTLILTGKWSRFTNKSVFEQPLGRNYVRQPRFHCNLHFVGQQRKLLNMVDHIVWVPPY